VHVPVPVPEKRDAPIRVALTPFSQSPEHFELKVLPRPRVSATAQIRTNKTSCALRYFLASHLEIAVSFP
jgi:hypothetical protein